MVGKKWFSHQSTWPRFPIVHCTECWITFTSSGLAALIWKLRLRPFNHLFGIKKEEIWQGVHVLPKGKLNWLRECNLWLHIQVWKRNIGVWVAICSPQNGAKNNITEEIQKKYLLASSYTIYSFCLLKQQLCFKICKEMFYFSCSAMSLSRLFTVL